MEPAVIVAGLAGVPATVAAVLSWTNNRKTTETSSFQAVYDAMSAHMATITAENMELRNRQRQTEKELADHKTQAAREMGEVKLELQKCHSDKGRLELLVRELMREVRGVDGTDRTDA